MADKLPLKPLGFRVLVKPQEHETTTPSGLLVSTNTQEKPQMGEVLGLGTGGKDKEGVERDFVVKVGDKVFFKKYSPDEIEVDSIKYLILDETDILGVLNK